MATHTLVRETPTDVVALIGLALRKHGIPVAAQFWLQSEVSNQEKVVIVTPYVDAHGASETYSRIFAELDSESFLTRSFLRSDLVLFGEREAAPALEAVRSGTLSLSRLGPYEDVKLTPIPDASEIVKGGFLHFSPVDTGSYIASFGAFGHGGWMKPRAIDKSELNDFLSNVRANESQKAEVTENLQNHRSASIVLNISLATLYDLGLI
jgi:hypothetical protein